MKQHGPRTQVEQAYAIAHDNHLKVVEKPPGRWNVYRVTAARLVFLFRTARPPSSTARSTTPSASSRPARPIHRSRHVPAHRPPDRPPPRHP